MIGEISLRERCEALDAFETDPWAAEAILDAELLTYDVIDPNCGKGVLADAAHRRGHSVITCDIHDWSKEFPECRPPDRLGDWTLPLGIWDDPIFAKVLSAKNFTVFMNPPFSLACEFVDRAIALQARKIVCFQRWAWRESVERDQWWEKNPPARIWICRERASCYRFDIPHVCPYPDWCENQMAKKRVSPDQCRECLSGSTQAHAWFVWERGHKGAEIINVLRKKK